LKIVKNYNNNISILDEQRDGDYFDRTEKNQLFLWEVLTEVKNKARMKVDLLNNTI